VEARKLCQEYYVSEVVEEELGVNGNYHRRKAERVILELIKGIKKGVSLNWA